MNNQPNITEDAPIACAARRLVDLKFAIDTEARSCPEHIPKDLHGPYTGGEFGPHFGSSFLSAILPFVPNSYETDSKIIMDVPTAHVLGCSWRIWPNPNISTKEKTEVIDYLNSSAGINDTFYTYIPELMIFSAEEGKNRVNFCRFHNIEFIPAQVRVKNYPSPDRIKIYTLEETGGLEVWAVLDSRYAKRVPHYAYTLPMLRAYGVEILDSWPIAFPSIINLLQHRGNDVGFKIPEIDMKIIGDQLLDDEKKQNLNTELVPCSLFELDIPMNRMLMIMFSLLVISCFTSLALPVLTLELLPAIALVLFSFTVGCLFTLLVPLFKCQRRLLRRH